MRRSSRWFCAVTSAVQPGSTTVVALASRISAGPGRRSPASRAARSNTGAAWSVPPVQTATVSTAAGAPEARAGSAASATRSPVATASTATASTTSPRSGVAKPNRARCAAVKSSRRAGPSGTSSAACVPA